MKRTRWAAANSVAQNREIQLETVISKFSTQLGLTTAQFDEMVLRWLRDQDDTLQQQIEARVSAWNRDADLRTIREFFGKTVAPDPARQPLFWWVNQSSLTTFSRSSSR